MWLALFATSKHMLILSQEWCLYNAALRLYSISHVQASCNPVQCSVGYVMIIKLKLLQALPIGQTLHGLPQLGSYHLTCSTAGGVTCASRHLASPDVNLLG